MNEKYIKVKIKRIFFFFKKKDCLSLVPFRNWVSFPLSLSLTLTFTRLFFAFRSHFECTGFIHFDCDTTFVSAASFLIYLFISRSIFSACPFFHTFCCMITKHTTNHLVFECFAALLCMFHPNNPKNVLEVFSLWFYRT